MKHLIAGLMVVSGCLEATESTSTTERGVMQVEVYHSSANGAGAVAMPAQPTPWSYYMVQVFESGVGQAKQTNLFFNFNTADESSLVCTPPPFPSPFPFPNCSPTRRTESFGYGVIPQAGVNLAIKGAHVTTAVPADGDTFFSQTCAIDTVAGTYECSTLGGEPIDLHWASNGSPSIRTSGLTEFAMGNLTFRTVGTELWSGATVVGSFGTKAINGVGSFTSTHGARVVKSVIEN